MTGMGASATTATTAARARGAVALLAAPLAWFAHLNVSYLLVPLSCRSESTLPLHLATVTAAAVAGAGLVVGVQRWRAGGASPLFGVVSVALSALFLLVILLTSVSNLVIDPCR